MEFDALDLAILRMLHDNARVSLSRVAESQGVALATVHRRIQRLRAEGVVQGFATRIDPKLLGYAVTAFVRLRAADRDDVRAGFQTLNSIPEVEEVHVITGGYDVLIKVRSRDTGHLRNLLARIHRAMGAERSSTEVCLESPLERFAPLHLVLEQESRAPGRHRDARTQRAEQCDSPGE